MPRKSRRAHNEGSVFQRKDGRWVVQVYTEENKYKQVYVKSQKEGVKKLKELQQQIAQGTLPTGPDQTLEQYLGTWLEEVHKPKIKVSTYVKYRKIIYSYIIPGLGSTKLQKLTPQQVNSFYRKKEKDGLKPKTINDIHGVLHKAIDDALKWQYVSRNVCDAVSPPRVGKSEQTTLTVDQVNTLLEAISGHRLEALITLALLTGMRRGELLALRWTDIDLEKRTVTVRRTVDYIPKHGFVENEPKTEASGRIVVLALPAIEALKKQRLQQLELKLKCGHSWEDRDLVFTDLHGGYFNPRYLEKTFKQIIVSAGLPGIRFHDMRHTCATLLLSMKVDMKVIQEILGHSTIAMTAGIYAHVSYELQDDAMSKWNTVISQKRRVE